LIAWAESANSMVTFMHAAAVPSTRHLGGGAGAPRALERGEKHQWASVA